MHENTEKTILRDCPAIRIPSGEIFTLAAGTRVMITQALGGSYTVATDQGLARITDAQRRCARSRSRTPDRRSAAAVRPRAGSR